MSNILQEIEAQIAGVKTSVEKRNVGTVREISDGVAKIEGLTDAMLNEMLDFGNGVIGLASTSRKPRSRGHPWRLSRRRRRFGSQDHGQTPLCSSRQRLLGRVVDCLGRPVDGKGPIKESGFYPSRRSLRASSGAGP